MTLATEVPSPVFTPVLAREAIARRIPVLKTDRLVLRALCQRDVPVIVQLAGDRRVAENTARIPHPYAADEAEQFVAQANRQNDSATFAITLNGSLIGACGIDVRQDGAELGYWLGVPFWGCGYATEAVRAVIDYGFGALGSRGAAFGRPRQQPGVTPRAGKVRLPMERCPALPDSGDQFGSADRPLSSRSPAVGVAQGLGIGAASGLKHDPEKACPRT